jgi:hypothetical protein
VWKRSFIALYITENTLDESITELQQAADDIAIWTREWRIKLNETKSIYISISPTISSS